MHVTDTPSMTDCQGISEDENLFESITQFLIKQGKLNAICIVIKSTESRARASLKYYINELRRILPKDV